MVASKRQFQSVWVILKYVVEYEAIQDQRYRRHRRCLGALVVHHDKRKICRSIQTER